MFITASKMFSKRPDCAFHTFTSEVSLTCVCVCVHRCVLDIYSTDFSHKIEVLYQTQIHGTSECAQNTGNAFSEFKTFGEGVGAGPRTQINCTLKVPKA